MLRLSWVFQVGPDCNLMCMHPSNRKAGRLEDGREEIVVTTDAETGVMWLQAEERQLPWKLEGARASSSATP